MNFLKKGAYVLVVSLLTATSTAFPASANEANDLTAKTNEDSSFSALIDSIIEGDTQFNVTSLKETTITKNEALKKYSRALGIVEKYFAENNIKIEQDLDNIEYQKLVKSLGASLDDFSESDRKEILELVKFVDLYENTEKNKTINEYKSKLYTKSINEEELGELLELVPVSLSDPTTVQTSVYKEDADVKLLAYANGYSPTNAINYAYKWWDGRNPTYSNYYANYFGCTISSECWNDCTNFVSQALYAGGMIQWSGHF